MWHNPLVKRYVFDLGSYLVSTSARLLSGTCIILGASPSQMNLLFESFFARVSAPKPVSLGAFRQVSSSTSDVSLLYDVF
jgi:hypothetical protein